MKSRKNRVALMASVPQASGMSTINLGAGAHLRVLARAEQTGGQCGAVIGGADPGFAGPPPHTHRFTELCIVLEGRLQLSRDYELLELGPQDVAVVPPGTVHAFRVCEEEPARWINVWAPGGFEGYFEEAAAALPADAPPDPAILAAIASRYGLQPADAPNVA
jgi:mannose-6-phosphate isomerase-like protein (cupin superfamily)